MWREHKGWKVGNEGTEKGGKERNKESKGRKVKRGKKEWKKEGNKGRERMNIGSKKEQQQTIKLCELWLCKTHTKRGGHFVSWDIGHTEMDRETDRDTQNKTQHNKLTSQNTQSCSTWMRQPLEVKGDACEH